MQFQAIHFSRFKPTYDSGGGSRRAMQIHEMFKNVIPDLRLITSAGGDKHERKLKKIIIEKSNRTGFFAPPRRSMSLRKWHDDHLSLAYRLHEYSKIWANSMDGLKRLDVAIIDDPIYFVPLFKKLRSMNIPVITSCQNIETLATNQVKKKYALDFLKEELELLSLSSLVITVSREEDILLNNLGIHSIFVPYYPDGPVLQRLLAIRENRKKNIKEGCIAIGNAGNVQTREGMEYLCRYWQKNHLESVAGKLLLGGFRSDEYFTNGQFGDSVECKGSLSNEVFDHMMSCIKGFICYQENGAGSLTRICEMLIAGVPVLANSHAARSYYNMIGVIEFPDLDDIGDALKQIDKLDGEIPMPPVPDLSALSSKIEKILR